MTNKYKVLWHASGYMDAQMIKNYLESFGIEVVTFGESVGQAYGLTTTPLGDVEIHVKSSQFEEAETILDRYYSLESLEDE